MRRRQRGFSGRHHPAGVERARKKPIFMDHLLGRIRRDKYEYAARFPRKPVTRWDYRVPGSLVPWEDGPTGSYPRQDFSDRDGLKVRET